MKELEATLGQVEASKQLLGKSKELSDKELHAADDDDFIQSLFSKYAANGKNGIKILTKDKAYICAQKYIEKWKQLAGAEN